MNEYKQSRSEREIKQRISYLVEREYVKQWGERSRTAMEFESPAAFDRMRDHFIFHTKIRNIVATAKREDTLSTLEGQRFLSQRFGTYITVTNGQIVQKGKVIITNPDNWTLRELVSELKDGQ